MNQLRTEPWLTEYANEILETIISNRTNIHVFEYGMGASTLWFAKQKSVQYVCSVEHDRDWFRTVTKEYGFYHKLGALIIREQPYHNAINDAKGPYDIILVDGRNRVKCIEAAIPHLAKDGILILDNSEREYYQPGINLMQNWQSIDTFQPEPDKYNFTYPGWKTTFFFKDGIPKYLKP